MATAVKVDGDAKSRLEELQAEIRLKTGKNVTQQSILSTLITDAYHSKADVIERFADRTVPLSDEELERMRAGRMASGTDSDPDHDETLYG